MENSNNQPFHVHEVTAEEDLRYRDSPTRSILKTPTAVFFNNDANRSTKRLTFAANEVSDREGSSDSSKTKETTKNQESSDSTPMVKVALSPVKSIMVSPEAWRAHQAYNQRYTDYANETEKTDYTYSRLSPFHNVEIVPGMTIRPNMSRYPIHPLQGSPTKRVEPVAEASFLSGSKDVSMRMSSFLSRTSAIRKLTWSDDSSLAQTLLPRWWMILAILFLAICVSVPSDFLSSIPSSLSYLYSIAASFSIRVDENTKGSNAMHLTEPLAEVRPTQFMTYQSASEVLSLKKRVEHLKFKINSPISNDVLTNLRRHLDQSLQKSKVLVRLLLTQCYNRQRRFYLKAYPDSLEASADSASHASAVEELVADVQTANLSVRQIISDAIHLYDADKTGRADFALETAGGQIVNTRCTVPYPVPRWVDVGPQTVISRDTAPGKCWAFQGPGHVVIKLSHAIHISGCTVEHIDRLLHPFRLTDSAPHNFSFWGLKTEMDEEPHLFGTYAYELDPESNIQYFDVQHSSSSKYQFVEFKILSNHGNQNYTCLYRLRVHGTLNDL